MTVPNNSFENDTVERDHRTLEEKVRSLLIGGMLQVKYGVKPFILLPT